MKVDVVMPKLGESIMEGTIIKWAKNVGDVIKKDETLLEISTDKVDSEIPSPASGTIVELLGKENQTIAVGVVIARIEVEAGLSAATPQPSSPEVSVEEEKKLSASKIEVMSTRTMKRPPIPAPVNHDSDRKSFLSPLVLSIAQKEGVSMEELQKIPGSGTGGRVTKNDLLSYVENRASAPKKSVIPSVNAFSKTAPAASPKGDGKTGEPGPFAGRKEVEIIPADAIRKKISQHMRQSLDISAHVYSVAECDMTRVREIIEKKKEKFEEEEGFKLTFNPFILFAVTKALQDFPTLNSSFDGEQIFQKNYVNLGMAVATERGLLVPVIKRAEEKSFRGIARTSYDLAMRTRARKLSVEDVEGSTFSVTNPGVFGNIFGLPIINQPNVGILGVGAIKKRPVVLETEQGDVIAIRSMVYLSLSFDHRLVDGDVSGKFLQKVVYYLENFSQDI